MNNLPSTSPPTPCQSKIPIKVFPSPNIYSFLPYESICLSLKRNTSRQDLKIIYHICTSRFKKLYNVYIPKHKKICFEQNGQLFARFSSRRKKEGGTFQPHIFQLFKTSLRMTPPGV